MNVRIVYDSLGVEKGYTTLTNDRKELMHRLQRLGVSVSSIKSLKIDGKEYYPEKLQQG
ncbi:hypothetical protein GCM10007111_43290 [Virgibacillus kapii]|uniref:Uncharacterized protein n=1 Tax=Virgibacillus kapii TaxID=1638645 RepID=A0ABQ2DXB7_9BACI|nr:hypothetical protein GCM10007111_43290 [Virgibacillus kapii]